jgi:hypothetical protein
LSIFSLIAKYFEPPARGRMRETTKLWALIFGEHKINAYFGAVNFLSLWRSIDADFRKTKSSLFVSLPQRWWWIASQLVQKKIVLNRTLCLLNFFNILKIKINEFNNIFIYFYKYYMVQVYKVYKFEGW